MRSKTLGVMFSKLAYCFLIAMNSDGGKQLCYPTDADQAQIEPVHKRSFHSHHMTHCLLTAIGKRNLTRLRGRTPKSRVTGHTQVAN